MTTKIDAAHKLKMLPILVDVTPAFDDDGLTVVQNYAELDLVVVDEDEAIDAVRRYFRASRGEMG